MRKKSHISLARYLIKSMNNNALFEHKKAFYLGSILPDCTPSFITKKHCINTTFDILKEEIEKITVNYNIDKGIGRYYCRHLGIITHYIADYFTLPHNDIFDGTIREHCSYEKELKNRFKEYVNSDEAVKERENKNKFNNIDEIITFVKSMHDKYIEAKKQLKVDCEYIVELCHKVVDCVLGFIELALNRNNSIKLKTTIIY